MRIYCIAKKKTQREVKQHKGSRKMTNIEDSHKRKEKMENMDSMSP